ncbi:MAG TPA: hypothetical protein VKG80_14270 [Trebonia sp.]|nr:hypothetical protein [Trebonia sp.]
MGEQRAVALPARRRRVLYVTGAAVLALAAAVTGIALAVTSGGGAAANATPVRLSAAPLGLNVAPWDYVYAANTSAGGGANVIQPMLKAVGIDQFRYGGGSYADYYDWRTSTDIGKCLPGNATASFTAGCASKDPLGFGQFSQRARAAGADSFVTVNYGSGTPAEAAAWVAAAARAAGEGVALWEVGNETYGCWEVDNELAGPPANFQGYQPATTGASNPTCPQTTEGAAAGTRTLATSYAANAQRFLRAMKAADPAARIGVPWAFGSPVQGADVPDSSEWNDTVLGADGKYVSFVDAHYYPFSFSGGTGGANPTDQQVLRALRDIPSLYGAIRAELNAHDPGASVVVGETAVSNNPTTTACTPAGALFAAGDVLSWLAAGAQSVDWWDMNNYGNTGASCVKPDYGLFTSSSPPAAEAAYYGYLLASVLARPHALLGTLNTSDPSDVLAFQSALPDGSHAVAFINTSTSSARAVTFQPSDALTGTLRTWGCGAGKPAVVTGTEPAASVANGIMLPAESMTVLETR